MSRLFLLLAAFAIVVLSGCSLPEMFISGVGRSVTGSGNLITLEPANQDFSRVEFSHAFQADVTQGESFSVVITIDDNLEQYLEVSQDGDTLKVGLEPGLMLSLRNTTMQARVTMPELTGVNGSGATRITIAGFEADQALSIDVSGASTLRGQIDAGDLRADVSGASRLELTGQGQDGRINVSGASQANLSDFRMQNVDVEASGASRAEVNASGRLDAEASGASTVLYSGDPTLGRIQTSGASNVRAR
jgi:hypothetical protein